MREHPILMKGPLVRATLEGRKTQTRRPIKPQPSNDIVDVEYDCEADLWLGNTQEDNDLGFCSSWAARCPLGNEVDRLWVRETWRLEDFVSLGNGKFSAAVAFQADGNRSQIRLEGGEEVLNERFGWRPSIHMPRWACRLVLPLVYVRVERVQDITEEDAKAEGVEPVEGSYREGFRTVAKRTAASLPKLWRHWRRKAALCFALRSTTATYSQRPSQGLRPSTQYDASATPSTEGRQTQAISSTSPASPPQ